MFKIFDNREHFYQWDLNQRLVINDSSIKEVHFCNKTGECALVCEVYKLDGANVVNVPNILLQYDWRIKVYAYTGDYTKVEACYKVVPRSKPADYMYTETEVKTWKALEDRVINLEVNGVPQEAVEATVEKYLKDNPIEVEQEEELYIVNATLKEASENELATDKSFADAALAIKSGKRVLLNVNTGYYTMQLPVVWAMEEFLLFGANITLVEDGVTSAGLGVQWHSNGYCLFNMSDLSSKEYVDNAINNIDIPSIEGLASKEYVDNAIEAIDIPTGGGSSSGASTDWELIGEATSDGNGDVLGIYIPIDMTQYKEVFISSKMIGGKIQRLIIGNILAWYNGNVIGTNGNSDKNILELGTARPNDTLLQSHIFNIDGKLFVFSGSQTGFSSGTCYMQPIASPRNAILATETKYVRVDSNNNGAVPEGCTILVYGRK